MNEDLIYTRNYYNLYRDIEQDDFVKYFNNSQLPILVAPSLQRILDKLYSEISTNENSSSTSLNFIIDKYNIDLVAEAILHKFNEGKEIDSIGTSELFTNSFDKLYRSLFSDERVNDGSHDSEAFMFAWLQDNLAKILAKDERFSSYELITKLLIRTEQLFYFYKTFSLEINLEWIKRESEKWIYISADKSVVFSSFDRGSYKDYQGQLNSIDNSTPLKYIKEATHFSGYVMFTDEYAIKNLILFLKDKGLWLKFWDNLELPILQDSAFHYLENPKNFPLIASELVSQASVIKTSAKHLSFILLKNLFEYSLKTSENLLFYNNQERIKSLRIHERNEKVILEGKQHNSLWGKQKILLYTEIISTLSKIIDIDEMSEWVFSYQPRNSNRSDYDNLYNSEVDNLVSVFRSSIELTPFENQIELMGSNFNLQKFVFLSSQINNEKNKEYAKDILARLFEYVSSEDFYWDETFSPTYWPSLKSMGLLISLLSNPSESAISFVNKFKINHEGWNVSSNEYKLMHKESFVFCGVILLLEHDEAFKDSEQRIVFFNSILSIIIKQSRFTVVKNISDYKVPLYLLYLIVNQVYIDLKEHYELEIINNIDKINSVIEILSNDNYTLSPSALIKLRDRIDKEFGFEKRKYIQRGQTREIQNLEKAIEKIGLS